MNHLNTMLSTSIKEASEPQNEYDLLSLAEAKPSFDMESLVDEITYGKVSLKTSQEFQTISGINIYDEDKGYQLEAATFWGYFWSFFGLGIIGVIIYHYWQKNNDKHQAVIDDLDKKLKAIENGDNKKPNYELEALDNSGLNGNKYKMVLELEPKDLSGLYSGIAEQVKSIRKVLNETLTMVNNLNKDLDKVIDGDDLSIFGSIMDNVTKFFESINTVILRIGSGEGTVEKWQEFGGPRTIRLVQGDLLLRKSVSKFNKEKTEAVNTSLKALSAKYIVTKKELIKSDDLVKKGKEFSEIAHAGLRSIKSEFKETAEIMRDLDDSIEEMNKKMKTVGVMFKKVKSNYNLRTVADNAAKLDATVAVIEGSLKSSISALQFVDITLKTIPVLAKAQAKL